MHTSRTSRHVCVCMRARALAGVWDRLRRWRQLVCNMAQGYQRLLADGLTGDVLALPKPTQQLMVRGGAGLATATCLRQCPIGCMRASWGRPCGCSACLAAAGWAGA